MGENIYGQAELKNCDCMKAIQYGLIDHFGRVERLFPPQAIAIGERPVFQESEKRLPAIPGIPEPARRLPVQGVPQRQQYIVVPRKPRDRIG